MKMIEEASAATSAVLEKVEVAHAALRHFEGRIVNGAGVFGDPSMRRTDIAAAKAALDAALEIMSQTSWPTKQDYEAEDC